MVTAAFRAAHVEIDHPPVVFDDPFARQLSGFSSDDLRAIIEAQPFPPAARLFPVTRARVVDEAVERAVGDGVAQFVVLGAGYDSFALRRDDLRSRVVVFEVDQQATQAAKKARIDELGLASPNNVRYVEADLNQTQLADALLPAGFDPVAPSIWSWLGVTLYLPVSAIEATLEAILGLTVPGSCLLTSFVLAPDLMDDIGRAFDEFATKQAGDRGEPQITRFTRDGFSDLLAAAGWTTTRIVSTTDVARWFVGRTDGLTPACYEEVAVSERVRVVGRT